MSGGRPVPEAQLHLTILHFGIYEEVVADLRRYRADVDEALLRGLLPVFLDRCNAVAQPTGVFTPERLELFGTRSTVLALTGSADSGLHEVHEACLRHLQDLLRIVLQADPLPFMRASPNFRHALTLRPHITLLKSFHESVPAVTVAKTPLHLELMPLRYA